MWYCDYIIFYVSRIAQHDSIYTLLMMMMLRFAQRGWNTYYHINMGVEATMIFSLFELMWPILALFAQGASFVVFDIKWNELNNIL